MSSADLLRVYSTPSSRLLMKMLKRTGPSNDPCSSLFVDSLQLDFVPLTTSLRYTHSASFQSISLLICYLADDQTTYFFIYCCFPVCFIAVGTHSLLVPNTSAHSGTSCRYPALLFETERFIIFSPNSTAARSQLKFTDLY